jgi:hypothetical protein
VAAAMAEPSAQACSETATFIGMFNTSAVDLKERMNRYRKMPPDMKRSIRNTHD